VGASRLYASGVVDIKVDICGRWINDEIGRSLNCRLLISIVNMSLAGLKNFGDFLIKGHRRGIEVTGLAWKYSSSGEHLQLSCGKLYHYQRVRNEVTKENMSSRHRVVLRVPDRAEERKQTVRKLFE
jgi:hypothetical protein